jgi:hypothetical protein
VGLVAGGDFIAVKSKIDGRFTLQVVPTDGSERPRVLDTAMDVTLAVLAAAGRQRDRLSRCRQDAGRHAQRHLRDLAGRRRRRGPLTSTDGDRDDGYQGPTPSPGRNARAVPVCGIPST